MITYLEYNHQYYVHNNHLYTNTLMSQDHRTRPVYLHIDHLVVQQYKHYLA